MDAVARRWRRRRSRSAAVVVERVSGRRIRRRRAGRRGRRRRAAGPALRGPVRRGPPGRALGRPAADRRAGGDTTGTGSVVRSAAAPRCARASSSNRDVLGSPDGAPGRDVDTQVGEGMLRGTGGTAAAPGRRDGALPEAPEVAGATSTRCRSAPRALGAAAERPRTQHVTLRFKLDVARLRLNVATGQGAPTTPSALSAVDALRAASPFPAMPNPRAASCAARSRHVQQSAVRRVSPHLRAARLALALVLVLAALRRRSAPAAASAEGSAARVDSYDATEQLSEKRTDTNKDCKPDEIVYYKDGKPERAEQRHQLRRQRRHLDLLRPRRASTMRAGARHERRRQGDRWIKLQDGKPHTQLDDKNGDGKPDSAPTTTTASAPKLEEDTNFDGRTDRSVTYRDGKPAMIEEDNNGDGKPDARAEFDPEGRRRAEQQDTNGDGKYDVTIHYENGKKVRVEEDTNGDGKPDVVTTYRAAIASCAARPTPTTTARSTPSPTYENGIEAKPDAATSTATASPSFVPTYETTARRCARSRHEQGRGRAELVRIFANGKRVREEEDPNGDGKPEVITDFDGDTPIRREADTNGDGKPDTTIDFKNGVKVRQEEDRNGDGKVDARLHVRRQRQWSSPSSSTKTTTARFEITDEYEGRQARASAPSRRQERRARRASRSSGTASSRARRARRERRRQGRSLELLRRERRAREQEQDADHDGKRRHLGRRSTRRPARRPRVLQGHQQRRQGRFRGAPTTPNGVTAEGSKRTRTATASRTASSSSRAASPCASTRTRTATASSSVKAELDADGQVVTRGARHRRRRQVRPARRRTRTARRCARSATRKGSGRFDVATTFENGKPVRQEQDTKGTGTFDSVIAFKDGKQATQERDTNGDGKIDRLGQLRRAGQDRSARRSTRTATASPTSCAVYANGVLVREEQDRDFDGTFELDHVVRPAASPRTRRPTPTATASPT